MNIRIVTWAALACLSAYTSSVGAVALGEMRALSALGEPLKLQLVLADLGTVNPADVRVVLAPADDYSRLGLIPPLGAEQWQVDMQNGKALSALITSAAVSQEPNVSFLVQLQWPGNIRVQQVTAVLLPAISAATEQAAVEPVLPAASTATEVIPVGGTAVAVPTPVAEPPANERASGVEQIATEPAIAHVRAGDTLSKLAKSWYLPQASLLQRQQVLAASNPQLFIHGNINQLKRGVIVRYPLPQGVTLPAPAQAAEWLAAHQGNAVESGGDALDQPALSAQAAAANAGTDQEVTLTLVSPGHTDATAQAASDEAETAGEMARLLARKTALLAERAALQAELAALEKSGSDQDARLKVLNASLAQLNQASAKESPAPAAGPDSAGSSRQAWLMAAVGFFAALFLVMRRRAARATAAAQSAQREPAPAPESDYVAFEPLETLPVPEWSSAAAAVAGNTDPDEEYDFLSDAESAALQTRLDLAQAYIDMQETELARELLSAVVSRGSAAQRSQAAALLASLS